VFISFEGADCVGKSTQIEFLKNYLINKNVNCIFTKEPGGTEIGQDISKVIQSQEIEPLSETLLLLSQRNIHINQLINPSLKSGKIVISDRFHDSTIAYQSYGKGVSENFINTISKELNFPTPDVTFIITIPFETMMNRINHKKNRDKFEKEGEEFFKRVVKGYENIASQNPYRCFVIDGNRTKDEIFQEILKIMHRFI
jgi:dTMP kinase